jgi:phosphoglycerate dehydrogenase-like enzyme
MIGQRVVSTRPQPMSSQQTADPDVVVLREGTEGLSMASYADALRDRLPDRTVALARTPAEERELVPKARVVTGITLDADLLDRADRLELFACTFAGTDHVPTDALRDHGVTVTNAGGIHAPGIAEQSIGNLLVFARNLHEAWRRIRGSVRTWRDLERDLIRSVELLIDFVTAE